MEQWKEYKYTELANIIGGGTPKTAIKEYWNGNIPWLSVKDFGNDDKYVYTTEKTITELGLSNSSTNLLQKEDIIISARGTVGELAMIPFPMSFNQSCFGIRAKENVNPHFLYYLTKTKIKELKNNSHGSVFDTITRATFENIICNVPKLDEQKRIADFLSSLDDKIELNRQINDNLISSVA
ncbi:MAG: restriction endonuclease subunit S [Muribaculaceae bacterium]|nr:restriction endonuclease subunit S [Muribaculaceae bacterium]